MKTKFLLIMLVFLAIPMVSCARKGDVSQDKPDEANQEVKIVNVLMKTSLGDIELELNREIAPLTVDNFVGLAMATKEFTDSQTRQLAKRHFYDGLIFHRVIRDFMIQGGCPVGTGTGGPGYTFADECYEPGEKITGTIENEQKANAIWTQQVVPYLRSNPTDPSPELMAIVTKCHQSQSLAPMIGSTVAFYEKATGRRAFYGQGPLKATVDYGTICMANAGPDTNGSQFFIVTKKDGADWLNGKHTVFGKVTNGMDVAHAIENVQTTASSKPIQDVKIISIRVVE